MGQRAREGARSEKLLAHGRLQTPPRPRRALPPHPLQPPRRLRIAASAEVSGVSGILRAGLFDLGTNQHCRWLFFVRRRVMGHCDDISAARRRGLCLEALGCVWANLQGAAAVVRCLGCRIINIGCETHRANAPVPQAREPPSGGPPLGRRLVSSPFTHDKFARSSFLLSFLLAAASSAADVEHLDWLDEYGTMTIVYDGVPVGIIREPTDGPLSPPGSPCALV